MAKKIEFNDNVFTAEETAMIKKVTSVKSWIYFSLWSLLSIPMLLKWAIWGSERFMWAKAYSRAALIFLVVVYIALSGSTLEINL